MSAQPDVPQKMPYVMDLDPGKYAWCACGKSSTQPFCDGAHKGSGMNPTIFEIDEAQKVALCGCKHTKSGGSRCDGSHSDL